MRYDAYKYLYPPRPEQQQAPRLLRHYEDAGWWAQIKMNGNCAVIAVAPDRSLMVRHRHGDRAFSYWQPRDYHAEAFRGWPGDGWYVVVGELLHTRGVGVKDTLYLFDLLVHDGDYLVGVPFRARQARLAMLCKPERSGGVSHDVINDHVWLARNHSAGLDALYESLTAPHLEGLVLKDPNAGLKLCSSPTGNGSWQVKVRRPTEHIGF